MTNPPTPPADVPPMPKAEVFFKSPAPYRAWKVENGTTSIERAYATLSSMYQQERAENERLREALTFLKTDHLRLLAHYFDVMYADDPNTEIQSDLRAWAHKIEAALTPPTATPTHTAEAEKE